MALLRRKNRPAATRSRPAPDPRIYGRHYTGPSPWVVGLFVADADRVRRLSRVREEDPVHQRGLPAPRDVRERGHPAAELAGADRRRQRRQGDRLERDGDAADVTFTVDDQGQPIHRTRRRDPPAALPRGQLLPRPRPRAARARPSSPTATRSRSPRRLRQCRSTRSWPRSSSPPQGPSEGAPGFGTALTYEPSAAADVTQAPDVQGKTGPRRCNAALRYGGPAGRDTSIVNEALLGESARTTSPA